MKLSIVSYLDSESMAEVRKVQEELSRVTGSVACLSSWEPHVTVGDGVELSEDDLQQFTDDIRGLTSTAQPFRLGLEGIGTIDDRKGGRGETTTPYVIYLKVRVNPQLLQLVDRVAENTSRLDKWYEMPRPYTPHCTLAFRDLSEEGFRAGIAHLGEREIRLEATIDHIALVEKLPEVDTELTRFGFQSG